MTSLVFYLENYIYIDEDYKYLSIIMVLIKTVAAEHVSNEFHKLIVSSG